MLFRLRSVLRVDYGIQHLSAGFLLVFLNIGIFLRRDFLILTKAYTVIGVATISIIRTVLADLNVALNDVSAGLLLKSQVLQIAQRVGFLDLTTVPEIKAELFAQRQLRGNVPVGHVIIIGRIRSKERSNDCKQNQEQNDDTANDRTLILAKATERTLEVADRLGIKLFIMTQVVSTRKLEFLSGDIIVLIHIRHTYFAPILILGSIIP